MKLQRWTACVVSVVAALAVSASLKAATCVLMDSLQGSTTGVRAGGTFAPGGWRVDSQYDSITWHPFGAGPVPAHGTFEYDVVGVGPACTGLGKNELSHMYDYTFGDADYNYDGYRNNTFKHFIRKQCDPGKENTLEIVWQIQPCSHEDDTMALSWDAGTLYHWKVEWESAGGNATLRTYRNGALILTQVCPGSWSPGGLSVRIAASTRRFDEGAPIGAVFSNVKVCDLNACPGAPAVTVPAHGETVNTPMLFVQWSGDVHSKYQVRINSANSPDAGIVWDSQEAVSDLNYAWTGMLPGNGAYYVFVRVGGDPCGWGPWSAAGRTFTLNTSAPSPGPNIVRVNGTSLRDNNGPFLGLGASYFQALRRCKLDRARFRNDCALLASRGFNSFRALSMVAWVGLEIAPVTFTNSAGQVIQGWSDYDQQVRDMIDIAYDEYGLRPEITVFADAQIVMPSESQRTNHMNRILGDISGREHKVILLEVANEHWQNGLPDFNDLRNKGQYLADRTAVPIALSSPAGGSSALASLYAGSAADLATYHFSRDTGTCEGGWLPVRDPWWAAHMQGVPPVVSNEPVGPGSSVSVENDPIKLCSAAVFSYLANLPMYVYHSRAGVFGWTGCCPPSGTELPFDIYPGFNAFQHLRAILPPDLGSWVRNDGLEASAPFTVYSNGQANKYWPDIAPCGAATTGCDRNIGAIKGTDFISFPMGILEGGVTLQARRPVVFDVYEPLSGTVVPPSPRTLNAGDQITLYPQPGGSAPGPGAYILKGVFGDCVVPRTSVSIDLGSPDSQDCMTHVPNDDGDTIPVTLAGRSCRRNLDGGHDFYFYFCVCDTFAFGGSRPDLYISVDYFDSGAGAISLEYDGAAGPYEFGGSVSLTNTNTWRRATFHVTDAWFENRQNVGADFRFGNAGNTFYLDRVVMSASAPMLPTIAEVTPDPDLVHVGSPYRKQLELLAGEPWPSWSLVSPFPPGLTVNGCGLVSGWTPTDADVGDHTIVVEAANDEGADQEAWVVRVLSRRDLDADGDVDQEDFGYWQACLSGDAMPAEQGCGPADLDGDRDVDPIDLALFVPCMAGAGQTPGC